jgi:cold shock CspA family protein
MALKISESEWPGIVARRERGEPVAAIARTHGCSPALIYGILKRYKPAPSEATDDAQSQSSAGRATEPDATRPDVGIAAPEPAPSGVLDAETAVESTAAPKQHAGTLPGNTPPRHGRFPYHRTALAEPIALTAAFDLELRSEVDAAIAAFEGAFDAALDDTRVENLELLRRAASDLMRAGARTTIVLERLMSATAKGPAALRQPGRSIPKREGAPAGPQSAPDSVSAADGLELFPGTVKWFSPAKAFGFIQMDDGEDVFVHLQTVERSGVGTLEPGQRVRVTTRPGAKGLQAERLEVL